MKKTERIVFIIFLFFSSVSSVYSIHFNLKISGGPGYLNLKHINQSLNDWEEWQKKEALFQKKWSFKGGEVKKIHTGYDFEGEIIISFTPHLGAGFGTGFIYGELNEEKTELTIEKAAGTYLYVRPTKISAIPLTLSGYYFYPLRKELSFFLKGGMALIWAKYIEREGRRKTSAEKFKYPFFQKATARGTAYQGSLGLIYEVDSNLRFFIEGAARLAKIDGFQGETEEGEIGTLFYFEEYDPDLEFWQAKNIVLEEKPSGENFRSVQKAVIDISGFSIKIGLLIRF